MTRGFVRGAAIRLVAVALAIGTVSDGRSSRIAYAQGVSDPGVVKALAEINRGQYAEAEALLKPLAARSPDGEAALELALFYESMGRRNESRPVLRRIADTQVGPRTPAADYVRLGRAARALREFQLANDAFRLAAEKAPNDPSVHAQWGELWLQAYNGEEAAKSFQDALGADDKWIPALLGMSRTLLEVNPPAAEKAVQQALALDPNAVAGHLITAQIELDKSNRDGAKAAIAKARTINPASLDAFALSGAIAYIEDRRGEFDKEVAAALAINPRFGEAYRVAADLAAANYRFEEATALSRKALEIEPGDERALAAFGVQLLRTGEESEARTVLEKAFAIDKFNRTTLNLLTMLDSLDKFQTIPDNNLVIKLHPNEAPVMREYLGPLAQQALETFAKKYDFTPQGPILIEMFPKHDDFAVRTVGLPGMIGALGACFGRVVTLDSPKARPPGDFNWAPTLWHELAHVITLQLSKQRVPRWLTEGISTYEEKLGSPTWGREGELSFAAAYAQGEHMTLRELNAAFQDPEKISLAYYEASILTEHIVQTYGMGGLRKLLVSYGDGLEGEAALKAGLGVDIDTLQTAFDKVLSSRYGSVAKALRVPKEIDPGKGSPEQVAAAFPESFQAQVAFGEALRKAGKIDEAFKVLERAAEMVPMATGPRSPRAMMAQMAVEKNDPARAISELEKLLQYENTDLDAIRLLAKQLEATNASNERLMGAYERIAQLDPFDAANHSRLGRLKLQAGDPRLASREFRAAIAAGSLDPAAAHSDLAESYLALGDKVQARRAALAAIEVAPGYPRAQELLLKVIGQ